MGLHQAIDILKDVHNEFCWKDQQSVTHALARMITPYCRGLMGWDARFPLWHFAANRPRAGKDYLAGVTHLIYEGRTCEDAPLDRDSEETRKRITAAMMSGRRIMHFANCQGHIQDAHFIGAITSKTFAARNLGSTEAKAKAVFGDRATRGGDPVHEGHLCRHRYERGRCLRDVHGDLCQVRDRGIRPSGVIRLEGVLNGLGTCCH